MGRLPLIASALVGVLLAVVVLHTKPAVSTEPSPPAEPPPTGTRGVMSDGGHMVLHRSGRWYAWRADSPPTRNCRPGRWRIGWNWTARDWTRLRANGRFDDDGLLRRPKIVNGRREQADIWWRIRGRISGGRARGTFERHESVRHNGRMMFVCDRRATFDVAVPTNG